MNTILNQVDGERFVAIHGDCVEAMRDLPDNSIDYSVYSPPFSSLYIYSESARDMGNVGGDDEFQATYAHALAELFRVTKPGRLTTIHVKDLVYYSNASEKGDRGLRDFSGACIKTHVDAGWTYHSRTTVRRCPVREMTKAKPDGLLYRNFRLDAGRVRQGLPEYIITFRKWAEGEQAPPIVHVPGLWPEWAGEGEQFVTGRGPHDLLPDYERLGEAAQKRDPRYLEALDIWQRWADPVWLDTSETDVLNVRVARDEEAEKHLCLARGSLVLTIIGFKPIEEVEVGELVLTHRGRWRAVIGKLNAGVRPVVTVRAQGVPGLTLTPDHKLWTRLVPHGGKWDACFARRRAERTEPSWVRSDEVVGSYVNLKLPPIDQDADPQRLGWTPLDLWIAGRWLGDGHFGSRGNLVLSCGQHEIDGLVSRLGDRCGAVNRTQTGFQIWIKDRDGRLRGLLQNCERGAWRKQIPAEAFAWTRDSARYLLDGYLSADGSFNRRRGRFMASSVSRALMLGVAMLFQRVHGVAASIVEGRPSRPDVIDGRPVNARAEWVMSAYVEQSRVKPFIREDGAWNKVRSVDPSEDCEVWCLRVDEDESFTAEGCVVKNCPMPLDLIDRSIRLWSNRGDVVLSPFMGIGSEGWGALRAGRRFIGVELKDSYFLTAVKNLQVAEAETAGGTLFEPVSA